MKCPHCHESLAISDRQGIEIDYCPSCRGVWLDRGELDKIIERSLPMTSSRQAYVDDGQYTHVAKPKHKHKQKSFLSDIFDFD